ncbi:hypothetical protein QN375_10465 [Pseudomonas sp. MH9.2]|uniref:dermonecrotic toxin domain-containing protein n=1 Tax=unclassified Pseudomonas TaxID=196821 RepID=UPI002AC8F823|nr:DUF6543 domain-containing protein [Pseudomonas sp. MH9.2]MEB0026191.1 hypothetical protein [Pseudomonas sp. MH9.2]WPX68682.1 hypothetical protein RHM55_23715 [Pseudomonas sp. MH9.2]
MTIKIDVVEQFLTRPTLRDVATAMLRDALSEKYPALSIEPEVAVVSEPPLSREYANTAGRLMTLTDCLLDNFSSQRPWHFTQGQHVLVAQPSAGEWMPLAVDMADISALLDRLSLVLIEGFEQATADYWCQPSTTGISRWEWLSSRLKQQLSDKVIAGAFPQQTDAQRSALSAVAMFADKAQRNALLGAIPGKADDDLRACIAYLNMGKEGESNDEPLPAIVLVGHTAGDEIVMVCWPSGKVESCSSQDQLGVSLGARLGREWDVDQLQWTLYEPEGNIFEALTQVLLETQLNTLQALKGADSYDLESLEQHLASATDLCSVFDAPGPANIQVPARALETLPEWLQHATITDRLDYSWYLAALAVEQERSNGQSFNDDLPSITDFTLQTLRLNVLEDHPGASDLSLDDIEIVIDKVTAAALPSGGQIVSVGGVERVRMTLSEFALENLSSLPYGSITLHRAGAQPIPDWFSVDYLKALTARANIGQAYPHLLERSLITDTEEAGRRQVLFARQLRIQLPLKALEQKIKGEGGFSEAGYRNVAALMKASGERKVGTHGIVIRPLAFFSHPGASADVVSNMFVIGPEKVAAGPHVLYRPFASQSLTEFGSWSALLAAIQQPGDMQETVLVWLGDRARLNYANGGFQEPHSVRFGLGSEFAPLERPQPAVLSVDTVDGDPLLVLFAANARALVDLADRNSVSNTESRWARLKQGGWLLLNVLLPFVSGPVANAVWLAQLMVSVDQALKAQGSTDASVQATALADFLLNISLILMHQGLSVSGSAIRTSGLSRRDEAAPSVVAEMVIRQSEPLAMQPIGAGRTVLDFTWSNPRNQLTATQRGILDTFKVSLASTLGAPAAAGPHEGLYEVEGAWYARVDSDLYRVMLEEDGVVVVDLNDSLRTGPWLKHDGPVWDLDLRLRLRGGGPKKKAGKMIEENAAKLKQITESRMQSQSRLDALYKKIMAYDTQLRTATGELRSLFFLRYEKDLQEVVEVVEQKIKQGQALRSADRPLEQVTAADLRGAARHVCYFEGLLLQDIQRMTRHDIAILQESSSDGVVVPANVDAYLNLFRKLLVQQEMGAKWADARELLWQQLRAVPKVGESLWRVEVLELHKNNMFTRLEWKVTRLFSLLELCFSKEQMLMDQSLKQLKALRNDDGLHGALSSHAELDKPNDYSLIEQINVLESAFREYGRAVDIAVYAQSFEIDSVQSEYLKRFLAEMVAIRDSAETRLSALIQEETDSSALPSEYVPKVEQPRKKIIRTRGQRSLVGQVRSEEPDFPGEVVDVTDLITHRVIGSYHQHADGEWVGIETAQPPTTTPKVKNVPLNELQRDALESLSQVERTVSSAWRQSKRASEPEDMQDILVQKAGKLSELADRLDVYSNDAMLAESVYAQVVSVLKDLRAAAARLTKEGRSIRISMIKARPPTAARINYLDRQGEVNISRFDGRKNLSGARRDDFLQEYAIRDKDNQILWWAHFHYATESASSEAFTAAHLKLPEQRRLGYKALLRAASDNKEVVSIYRSVIGKELAQRLFLVLAR